jgi:hypothetical protein
VDGHENIDELARDIELAIRTFDSALARHEEARRRTPGYGENTPTWEKVKDELFG